MATDREQVDFLISLGIMPSAADRIVGEAQQRQHRRLTIAEARPRGTITLTEVQRTADWWYFNPNVPNRIRLILDAQEV